MLFRASCKHQTHFLPPTPGCPPCVLKQTQSCHSLPMPHHRGSPYSPTSDPAKSKMLLGGLHSVARQHQRSFASFSLLVQNHQCLSKTQRSVPPTLLTREFMAVRCAELHCSCCLSISTLLRHMSEIQYTGVTVYVTCSSVYPPHPSSCHRARSTTSSYSCLMLLIFAYNYYGIRDNAIWSCPLWKPSQDGQRTAWSELLRRCCVIWTVI